MMKHTLPGSFESLARVSDLVKEAGQIAGLNHQAIYEAQSAVDEAFCNIIDHAYGGENKGNVVCVFEVTSEGLVVILKDSGKPFNPEGITNPSKPASLKDIKKGGLGLFFMRKMMDEVDFTFSEEHGNAVRMLKRKEA